MEFKGVFACVAEVAISIMLLAKAHARAPATSPGQLCRVGLASADDSNRLSDSPGREDPQPVLNYSGTTQFTMKPNLANSPPQRVPLPRSVCAVALLAIASAALPWTARANLVTSGTGITVNSNSPNPWTGTIGSGPSTATGTTVNLLPNAQVVVGDANGISLADNATITISGGALIQNRGVNTPGLYNTSGDTVEFRNNSTITINAGGRILSTGSQGSGEAINPEGSGNTITNLGTIRSTTAAAIWFQNVSGSNSVINESTGVIQAPGNVMGASGNGAVDFTNQGRVIGNLIFAGGNDALHLHTGSSISGSINGGGGSNLMTLNGTGSGSLRAAANIVLTVFTICCSWVPAFIFPANSVITAKTNRVLFMKFFVLAISKFLILLEQPR